VVFLFILSTIAILLIVIRSLSRCTSIIIGILILSLVVRLSLVIGVGWSIWVVLSMVEAVALPNLRLRTADLHL
jgi:hypothetical protein